MCIDQQEVTHVCMYVCILDRQTQCLVAVDISGLLTQSVGTGAASLRQVSGHERHESQLDYCLTDWADVTLILNLILICHDSVNPVTLCVSPPIFRAASI